MPLRRVLPIAFVLILPVPARAACPTQPVVTVTAGSDPACPGEPITYEMNVGYDSYRWTGGITATGRTITVSPSVTTQYNALATLAGCESGVSIYRHVKCGTVPRAGVVAGDLVERRSANAAATRLTSGDVLVCGGSGEPPARPPIWSTRAADAPGRRRRCPGHGPTTRARSSPTAGCS